MRLHGFQHAGTKYDLPESTVGGFIKAYRLKKSLAAKTKNLKLEKRRRRTQI